jgi:DNA-binding transcriptional regulator WhiA
MPKYTPEYLQQANELHLSGLSMSQVGKVLGSDAHRLRLAFKKAGIEIQDGRRKTNPQHDFFHNIDSEIKAYLLGFFASDGHIEKRNYDSYSLKWDLHEKDVELLHLINEHVGNNDYNIHYLKTRDVVGISITSKQIGEDLLALGYDNHKTHTMRRLPVIPESLMHHFLRGYFDGDGSISKSKATSGGWNRCFNIVSCYPEILEEIKKYLPVSDLIKYYLKTRQDVFGSRPVDSATLSCHSRAGIIEIYAYLYNDAHYFLNRKHEKFLAAMI